MNRVSKLIHLDWAHTRGYYGQGISIAVIDTGIANHPDFLYRRNRILYFRDFVNDRKGAYDDNGHGCHVCGILGGCGYASEGEYCGVAPGCNLIVLKVLDSRGNGSVPDVLQSLEWVISHRQKYNIRIMNISVGSNLDKGLDEQSDFVMAVNEVWNSGIIVVAAAGNNGPESGSIGAPGNSRKVITIGASDDSDYVNLGNGRINNYSSRGPTKACIMKPDLVAPGSNITSCNYHFVKGKAQTMYTVKSGTSMATPIVSGAAALLLSKYPDMTPREVKIRMKNRAVDLGLPHSQQGWGQVDLRMLLRE